MTWFRKIPHWPLIVGVLLSVGACEKKNGQINITRLLIHTPYDFDHQTEEKEFFRSKVNKLVSETPRTAFFRNSEEKGYRLQVRLLPQLVSPIASSDGQSGPKSTLFYFQISLEPPKGKPFYQAQSAIGTDNAFGDRGWAAFKQAWEMLNHRRNMEVWELKDVIGGLANDSVQIRRFSIEELGARREKEALQPLCDFLKIEKDERLILAAVGALLRLGDSRAVKPLIDLTYKKSPTFVLQVVFAVSQLGGRTAEGFLVTLAGGHPHPEVQQGAKDALAELNRVNAK